MRLNWMRERTTPINVLVTIGTLLIGASIPYVPFLVTGNLPPPSPSRTVLIGLSAFPLLVLGLREAARLLALHLRADRTAQAGQISSAWPTVRADLRTFTALTLVYLVPLSIIWHAPIDAPPIDGGTSGLSVFLSYALTILGFVCILLYGATVNIGYQNASYPIAGYPFADASASFLAYVLIVWACVEATCELGATDRWTGVPRFVVGYTILLPAFAFLCVALCDTFSFSRNRRVAPLLVFTCVGLFLLLTNVGLLVAYLPRCSMKGSLANLSFAWLATVVPWLTLGPVSVLAYVAPTQPSRGRSEGLRLAVWLVRLHLHLIRGHLFLVTIVRQNLLIFVISLPLSLIALWQQLEGGKQLVSEPITVIGLTAGWLTPLAHAIYFIDDTLFKAHSDGVHRALRDLRKHLLILGFGDAGRRLIQQLMARKCLPLNTAYPHICRSRNILLPTGALAKVIPGLAAVDPTGHRIQSSTSNPHDVPVAIADITNLVPDFRDEDTPPPLVRYVIPAVVGDPSVEEIQDAASFELAAFIALLNAPGTAEDASDIIQRRLIGLRERVPAALSIHSTGQIPFFTLRTTTHDLPVHYTVPEHLEGVNAGAVLYAAYVKHLSISERGEARVLVCGRGRRLAYLLDSFLKAFPVQAARTLLGGREPALYVLGQDESLGNLPPVDASAWDKSRVVQSLAALGLQPSRLSILRLIARQPAACRPGFGNDALDIPLIKRELFDTYAAQRCLDLIAPDVVMICDESAARELQWIHTIINALTRNQTMANRPLPQLLVSGDTRLDHSRSYFGDAYFYYGSCSKSGDDDSSLRDLAFPRLGARYALMARRGEAGFAFEAFVDALEEPVEKMAALITAYGDASLNEAQPVIPVQVDFCAADVAGAAAECLALLAGCRCEVPVAGGTNISLRDFRIVIKGDDEFDVRSFASLEHMASPGASSDMPPFKRVAITAGVQIGIRSEKDVLVRVRDEIRRLCRVAGYAESYWTVEGNDEQVVGPEQAANWESVADCCGMPACAVEGFHKLVETTRPRLRRAMEARSIDGAGRERNSTAEVIAGRYWATAIAGSVETREEDVRTKPLAHVTVRCGRAGDTGTFAVALASLLTRRVIPSSMASSGAAPFVFNLTGSSGYDCHDNRYALLTCYGRMERSTCTLPARLAEVVESVEIRPVNCVDRWMEYSLHLLNWFCKETEEAYVPEGRWAVKVDDTSGGALEWARGPAASISTQMDAIAFKRGTRGRLL